MAYELASSIIFLLVLTGIIWLCIRYKDRNISQGVLIVLTGIVYYILTQNADVAFALIILIGYINFL